MHLSWLTKTELRGPRPFDFQYQFLIGHHCCARVLLCAKILKETEETIGFNISFLSLVPLQLGGPPSNAYNLIELTPGLD